MMRVSPGRVMVAAGVLVLMVAGVNLAAPVPQLPLSPAAVLQLAMGAPRLIDYEGTKIISVQRNGQTETVTAAESHKRPDMTRVEYLSPDDVAGRLIVDDGQIAWHYEPRMNMAFEGPTMEGRSASEDLDLLHRNYHVSALGTDEILGRPVYVLALEPDGSGATRELWVDQATGTVLRTEERDPSRGLLLATYFSRISFSLNLPAAYFQFRPPAGARVFQMFTMSGGPSMPPAALQQQARFDVLVPPVLPEGYVFRGGTVSQFGPLTSVHLQYSDGENLLSLFEAPTGSIGWPAGGQTVQVGAQTARLVDLGYLRALIWEDRGVHLAAVGTMPAGTLLVIAAQLVGQHEQALVRTVSDEVAVAPGTVTQLRSDGLTFPEITQAVVVSRSLGTDVPTAVHFLEGDITAPQLAQQLGMTPEALRQNVRDALDRASSVGPHLSVPTR